MLMAQSIPEFTVVVKPAMSLISPWPPVRIGSGRDVTSFDFQFPAPTSDSVAVDAGITPKYCFRPLPCQKDNSIPIRHWAWRLRPG